MKKISESELENLVNNLVDNVNYDHFVPDFIVETGYSAHYLASRFSKYFSKEIIKLAGKRCNSDNVFLSIAYSLARYTKRGLFRVMGSGDNYFLNISRNLVLKIYEKNYPYIENSDNNHQLLKDFNIESKILIVGDNAFTGRTINRVTEFLISKGFKEENIKSCTLSSPHEYKSDYYSTTEAISFPWNPIGV